MGTEENPELGWTKRVLPVASLMFIAFWLLDYVQPAEHHNVTTALALLAIGTSQFMVFLFYMFGKVKFRLPILSDLGKNILLMFLFTGVYSLLYDNIIPKSLLIQNSIYALILVGLLPFVIQFTIAWILARYRIYIKF
jgi:hypothetical protein